MQNEALHIVILLNKSQDCELKLFRIFLTLFSIRLVNMNLRLESESASRRKFAQLVDGEKYVIILWQKCTKLRCEVKTELTNHHEKVKGINTGKFHCFKVWIERLQLSNRKHTHQLGPKINCPEAELS